MKAYWDIKEKFKCYLPFMECSKNRSRLRSFAATDYNARDLMSLWIHICSLEIFCPHSPIYYYDDAMAVALLCIRHGHRENISTSSRSSGRIPKHSLWQYIISDNIRKYQLNTCSLAYTFLRYSNALSIRRWRIALSSRKGIAPRLLHWWYRHREYNARRDHNANGALHGGRVFAPKMSRKPQRDSYWNSSGPSVPKGIALIGKRKSFYSGLSLIFSKWLFHVRDLSANSHEKARLCRNCTSVWFLKIVLHYRLRTRLRLGLWLAIVD